MAVYIADILANPPGVCAPRFDVVGIVGGVEVVTLSILEIFVINGCTGAV
jgi:hypothetical protein